MRRAASGSCQACSTPESGRCCRLIFICSSSLDNDGSIGVLALALSTTNPHNITPAVMVGLPFCAANRHCQFIHRLWSDCHQPVCMCSTLESEEVQIHESRQGTHVNCSTSPINRRAPSLGWLHTCRVRKWSTSITRSFAEWLHSFFFFLFCFYFPSFFFSLLVFGLRS